MSGDSSGDQQALPGPAPWLSQTPLPPHGGVLVSHPSPHYSCPSNQPPDYDDECRNPKDTQRPTFDCIQTYLDSPEDSLLQWSPGDLLPGKQAHVLGAPLVEGNNLYIDLQRTYQNQMLAETQSSHT